METSLCLQGYEDVVLGWLDTITLPVLLSLHLHCWESVNLEPILVAIGAEINLQHLHLKFHGYLDEDWSFSDILSWLCELPELFTL